MIYLSGCVNARGDMHVLIHDRVHRLWRCECGEIIGTDVLLSFPLEGIDMQDEICQQHRRHVEAELGIEKLKFGMRSQRLGGSCFTFQIPTT